MGIQASKGLNRIADRSLTLLSCTPLGYAYQVCPVSSSFQVVRTDERSPVKLPQSGEFGADHRNIMQASGRGGALPNNAKTAAGRFNHLLLGRFAVLAAQAGPSMGQRAFSEPALGCGCLIYCDHPVSLRRSWRQHFLELVRCLYVRSPKLFIFRAHDGDSEC